MADINITQEVREVNITIEQSGQSYTLQPVLVVGDASSGVQSVTGNLIDNTDPLNPKSNASSAISTDTNNAATLGTDNKIFVPVSVGVDTIGIDLTARIDTNSSSSWRSWNNSVMYATSIWNQDYGSDATPNLTFPLGGVFIKKGQKISEYSGIIRAGNSNGISMKADIYFAYPDDPAAWNDLANTNYVLLGTTGTIDLSTGNEIKNFTSDLADYEALEDGYVVVYYFCDIISNLQYLLNSVLYIKK